jgi:hypothetical protein
MGILDVKSMTPSQRVLAMEALWESMCQEEGEVASPDWHEAVLEERRARIERGEVGFVTLQQLKVQVGR